MRGSQRKQRPHDALIGMGANLDHPEYGSPVMTLKAALADMARHGITVKRRASWYRSAPVPLSDQPWFVNTVVSVSYSESAEALLGALHEIENKFGRVRQLRWEARVIDLDLLCFNDLITENRDQQAGLVLPHPHLCERAFVLEPIAEIDPEWRHPENGRDAGALLRALSQPQQLEKMADEDA